MKITVRYFASIREAIGTGLEPVQTTAATLGALRDELIARGGPHADSLARGKAVRMALNQTLSDESAALADGAEVAFFPPVTGGRTVSAGHATGLAGSNGQHQQVQGGLGSSGHRGRGRLLWRRYNQVGAWPHQQFGQPRDDPGRLGR